MDRGAAPAEFLQHVCLTYFWIVMCKMRINCSSLLVHVTTMWVMWDDSHTVVKWPTMPMEVRWCRILAGLKHPGEWRSSVLLSSVFTFALFHFLGPHCQGHMNESFNWIVPSVQDLAFFLWQRWWGVFGAGDMGALSDPMQHLHWLLPLCGVLPGLLNNLELYELFKYALNIFNKRWNLFPRSGIYLST